MKIEVKDLRTNKGVKGLAGWIPKSEEEKNKFREFVLSPKDGRGGCRKDWRTQEVKATTTAMRNKNKFAVPDEIREMASEVAKFKNPVRRKIAAKNSRKARRDRAVLPRGKVLRRPVVTKLWVNGRASEERDELGGRSQSSL